MLSLSNNKHSYVHEMVHYCRFDAYWTFQRRFYLFISRERRREGEREGAKHQCEKHQSVASLVCPSLGLNPQPRHMCPDWNQTESLLLCEMMPNQLSHAGQGYLLDI